MTCRPLAPAMLATVLVGSIGLASPADARVWVGVALPFPFFVAPPPYYPPPAYYYPPPAYYPPPGYYYGAPPPYSQPAPRYTPSSQSCIAGPTVCPMEHPVAPGSTCYCTTGQGRFWGHAT
jgi:hypothetical protein